MVERSITPVGELQDGDYPEVSEPVRIGPRIIYPSGKVTDAQSGQTLINGDGELTAPVNNEKVSTDSASIGRLLDANNYNGADGGEKIQNALDDLGSDIGTVVVNPKGPDDYTAGNGDTYTGWWALSSALEIPSNTTLLIHGNIVLKDDSEDNLIRNKKWDQSGRDEDIHIIGVGRPTLDQRAGHQNRGQRGKQMDQLGLRLYKVDGLTIRNLEPKNTTAWAIRPEDVTDLTVENIWFDQNDAVNNQDGVHIVGPCDDLSIDGLHGRTFDDACALSIEDKSMWTEADESDIGDIANGTISNITTKVEGGAPPSTLKFVIGNAGQIRNISVSDLVQWSRSAVTFWNYIEDSDSKPPLKSCQNIQINGIVSIGEFENARDVVTFNGGCRDVTVSDIQIRGVGKFGAIIRFEDDTEKIRVNDVNGTQGFPDDGGFVSFEDVTVDNVRVSDVEFKNISSASQAALINQTSGGTVTNAKFRDITAEFFGYAIDVSGSMQGTVRGLETIDTQNSDYSSLGSLKFVGDNPAFDAAPPAVKGSEVIASATWDPDGDGNGERVLYDGAWQEVVDLPNW